MLVGDGVIAKLVLPGQALMRLATAAESLQCGNQINQALLSCKPDKHIASGQVSCLVLLTRLQSLIFQVVH